MDNDDKKLEWMYSKSNAVDRDSYLTGKKVDKNFEENTLGNCVEYEVLPASIGRHNADDKHIQVDILRKEMEDPLMLIRQKEMEARRKILENPLKLKKLNEILRKEDKNDTKKPAKKKKKKRSRSSSSSSSGSDSEDLDKLLMEKYKKLQGKSQPADEESSFVDKKFKALTKELDKIVKKKKKRSSSSSESERDSRHKRDRDRSDERRYVGRQKGYHPDNRHRNRSRERESRRDRSDSRDRFRRKSAERKNRSNSRNRNRHRSRSVDNKREKRRDRSREHKRNDRSRSRDDSRKHKTESRKRSRTPDRKEPNNKKSDERVKSKSPRKSPILSHESRSKQFGLVTASGEKIETSNKREVKLYTKDELKPKREEPKKYEKSSRKQLTDEEKEKRLREMQSNAGWREKDREQKVKKYYDDEEKERKQHEKDFDREFINRSLKHAQNQIGSLESRIKSNVNNIQRSGHSMNQNFAKR